MLRLYRYTSVLIIIFIFGAQWGFYKHYTSQFPNFIDKSYTTHIHGALWMTWLCLLVMQPLLIYKGRADLHRKIGKVSYVLGPVLILFLYLAGRESYWKFMNAGIEREALKFLVLDSRGLFSFTLFWSLAMLNLKKPAAHMRYMIATGILAMGPGFGRGLVNSFDFDFGMVFSILDLTNLLLVSCLLGYDLYKKQNYKPWLVVWFAFLVGGILWQLRYNAGWQAFAKIYASVFY